MPTRPPRAHAHGQPPKPQPPRVRKPNPHQALYDSPEWRRASKEYRALHPWCECEHHQGKPASARSECVDHIIPHRGDRALFLDRSNFRAMAWGCHTAKTNRTDGGFGNARKSATAVSPDSVKAEPAAPRDDGVWFV